MTKQTLTGQNLLYALGAAAAVVLIISAIFIVITTLLEAGPPPLQIIYGMAFCFGPVVFLITFALLQRFRTDRFNYDRN